MKTPKEQMTVTKIAKYFSGAKCAITKNDILLKWYGSKKDKPNGQSQRMMRII